MMGIGTEYTIVKKPLYWGGGRYVQYQGYLIRKMPICTGMSKKLNKSFIQSHLQKIDFP
jgi:hypothetical protein